MKREEVCVGHFCANGVTFNTTIFSKCVLRICRWSRLWTFLICCYRWTHICFKPQRERSNLWGVWLVILLHLLVPTGFSLTASQLGIPVCRPQLESVRLPLRTGRHWFGFTFLRSFLRTVFNLVSLWIQSLPGNQAWPLIAIVDSCGPFSEIPVLTPCMTAGLPSFTSWLGHLPFNLNHNSLWPVDVRAKP